MDAARFGGLSEQREPWLSHAFRDRPAFGVRTTAARCEHSPPHEIVRGVPRPSVQPPSPRRRHGRPAPHGSGQRSGDRCDGVGVAASADGALHGIRQRASPGDCAQRTLERPDHPAVALLETAGMGAWRESLIDERAPPNGIRIRQECHLPPHVELTGDHAVPDGRRPDDARARTVGFPVREFGDRPCCIRQIVHRTVQISESERAGAHQRSVPRTAPGPLVHTARRFPDIPLRETSRHTGEHRPGLSTDVLRRACPLDPSARDLLASAGAVQAIASGEHVQDGHGHARVIGPFTRRVTEDAAPEGWNDIVRERRTELVLRAERVSGCRGEHRADCTIELDPAGGVHGVSFITRTMPGCRWEAWPARSRHR